MSVFERQSSPCRAETILFIGAGASAKLAMPPTDAQAKTLFKLCDQELTEECIEGKCFDEQSKRDICQLLRLLDYDAEGPGHITDEQMRLAEEAFPEATEAERRSRVVELRRNYDLPTLRRIALARKYGHEGNELPPNYLQDIYTMMDVLLREQRGFVATDKDGREVYYDPARLRGARQLMVLITNLMFGCAYQKAIGNADTQGVWDKYRRFADALAELMQEEAEHFEAR